MKRILLSVLCISFLPSCKQPRKDLLIRRWQATSVESPSIDQQIAEQRNFIDTVGRHNDANANDSLYGVRNMDSMRAILGRQLDSEIALQKQSVTKTWMEFYKDGRGITDFGNGTDTVSWKLDGNNYLEIEEIPKKNAENKIRMEIVELTPEKLLLRLNEKGYSSTATFVPVK